MDEVSLQRPQPTNWKVKVYLLNQTGNWDDFGTGNLDIQKGDYLGEETEYFKIISSEELDHDKLSKEFLEKFESLR